MTWQQHALGILTFYGFPLTCVVLLFLGGLFEPARAHDPWHVDADWYSSQTINEAARKRLGVSFKSCCDAGDHYQTRFKLVEDGSKFGAETYEYWHRGEGRWRLIPPDIVQRKKTPDGQPVLFVRKATGEELCFIIDDEGI